MCGIVGCVALNHNAIYVSSTKVMVDKLFHRGPDDAGYLYFHTGCRHPKGHSFYLNLSDKRFSALAPLLPSVQSEYVQKEIGQHDWDLFLGHRRLAILDLTETGHQPMGDLSQNIWIVYNGEIYNFEDIKSKLEQKGHKFKGRSDTEVIIYAYIEWGIDSIKEFNGMYSFVIYDNFQKKIYLVRDRYGIKPLYYSLIKESNGWTLVFASEIKAIMEYGPFVKELDYDGLVEYFSFQNFFSDRTIWKGVKILLPGHYLEVNLKSSEGKLDIKSRHRALITVTKDLQKVMCESNLKASIVQYWDFEPFQGKFKENEQTLIKNLEEVFEKAVMRQLVSDVEIGGYLSGGIDSGSITAIASKYFRKKERSFKSFTIGFDLHSASGIELVFDEREKAEHMSYLFGTEHYEMVLKAGDMQRCLPALAYHLEEPRVGQSYPNYYASLLASKFVKVVLSGCGGDELFGGYPWRYANALTAKHFGEFVSRYYDFWLRLFPQNLHDKVFSPIKDYYSVDPREVFMAVIPEEFRKSNYTASELIELALYFEQKTFLHGLLVVEDKLSMAHSLETRVPFLDNEIVNYALKIPINLKLRNIDKYLKINENEVGNLRKTNDGKLVLRKMIRTYVSEKIVNAIKQGFSAPDSSWFRGESIEFVKEILLNRNAYIYRYLDYNIVRGLLMEHLEGKQNRRLLIWSLLRFEMLGRVFGG